MDTYKEDINANLLVIINFIRVNSVGIMKAGGYTDLLSKYKTLSRKL